MTLKYEPASRGSRTPAARTRCPLNPEPLLSFFFFTLVTGPRRSLSLKLSGTRVYEPPIRARCRAAVVSLGAVLAWVTYARRKDQVPLHPEPNWHK